MGLQVRPLLPAKYVPHSPYPKQQAFLTLDQLEAMYGGAAGGGKSDALLMGALQYVHIPRYAALILRKSYRDLALPDAIMDRAKQWLRGTDAHWREDIKTYEFPSGATLTFGYLAARDDHLQYQGAAFQYIAFDELTQFRELQYTYLISRARRPSDESGQTALAQVPIRVRSASNPGGPGHQWVLDRFVPEWYVAGREHGPPRIGANGRARLFIPATIADNPALDREEYERTLAELDPVTRRQLMLGDWSVRQTGGKFLRGWFPIIDYAPVGTKKVRAWDLAATEPRERGDDPDYTAGTLVGVKGSQFYIFDVRRMQGSPGQVDEFQRQAADEDGPQVPIYVEEEKGGSGKVAVHHVRTLLKGHAVWAMPLSGDKEVRANPISAKAYAGQISIVRGGASTPAWVGPFLDELEDFPYSGHKDQVDSFVHAVVAAEETQGSGGPIVVDGHRGARRPRAAV